MFDIWNDRSNPSSDGRCGYVTYLCRLLSKTESDVRLSMLSEMFVSDPVLLVMSLRVVLEEEEELDHTHHTKDGIPRSVVNYSPIKGGHAIHTHDTSL